MHSCFIFFVINGDLHLTIKFKVLVIAPVIHVLLGKEESTLIFSNNSTSWGSFYYEKEADALRVLVKNQTLQQSVEWLKYDFVNQTENSSTIALTWEKRMIAFKVEADINKLQIESFRKN